MFSFRDTIKLESPTMSILRKALVKITGNHLAHKLLEKNADLTQYLMGIGTAVGADSNGEMAVVELLKKKYQPPYCIFDVGSNKGQYLTALINTLLACEYTVHCFEPASHTFNLLKETANAFCTEKIKLNNFALGKEQGQFKLYYNAPGSGLASLTKRRLDHFNIDFDKSEVVEVDTLDNYCQKNEVEFVHLLKMDVEGHELDVLKGAENMLNAKKVGMISFEFGGCNIDTRSYFLDFFYLFGDLEMNVFRITPSGYLYPMKDYDEIYEQFRVSNYVAVSKCLFED